MKTSGRGFTLIELLVVVSIIAILSLMIFPSINKLRERAKIGRAKSDMQALANGIMAYWSEYTAWPQDNENENTVDGTFYDLLAGVSGCTNNPREITFMPRPPGNGKDPWTRDYTFQCDYSGDKMVGTNTDCRIVIHSQGPDDTTAEDDLFVIK